MICRSVAGWVCLLLVAVLAGCASAPTVPPPPTPAAVHVLATDLTAALLLDLAEAYGASQSTVAVVPVLDTSASVAEALAGGRADLALTTLPAPGLFATPLAYAQLAVVVPTGNPVGPLSHTQAQALFTGEIADWALLGGPAGPVQAVVPDGGEAAVLFNGALLGAVVPSDNALVAPSWDAMRVLVGDDPGAVGVLPSGELSAAVRAAAEPEALRVLVAAVAVGEPAGPARAFLAWAQSEAGQAVVAERHAPLQ